MEYLYNHKLPTNGIIPVPMCTCSECSLGRENPPCLLVLGNLLKSEFVHSESPTSSLSLSSLSAILDSE